MSTLAFRRAAGRGFTLLELVITVSVLALVATLALPSLGSTVERSRLKAAAESLASDLAEARFESARRGQPLQLDVTPGPAWCWAVTSSAGCACDQAQRCRLKGVVASEYAGIQMVDASPTHFDPSGAAETRGGALFQSTRGERLRVELMPLGRARVCAPERPVAGYPAC